MQDLLNSAIIFIQLAAFILSILLSILISRSIDKQPQSNTWLFLFLMLNTYGLSLFIILKIGLLPDLWFLHRTGLPSSMLVPAVAYLYLRSSLLDERRLKWKDSIHLSPLFLGLLQYSPYYLSSSNQKKELIENINNVSDELTLHIGLIPEKQFLLIRSILLIFYAGLILHIIYQTFYKNKVLTKVLSKFDQKVYIWLKTFGFTFSINALAIAAFFCLQYFQNAETNSKLLLILGVIITIVFNGSLIYYTSYLLLKPETLIGIYRNKAHSEQNPTEKNSDQNFEPIIKLIKRELEENKVYFNPDLSLEKLAQSINQSTRLTSYVINNCFGMNFNQLINKYRIEETIQKLNSGYLKDYTLDALWKEVGFSNRTTFYKKFRESTGMTPVELLKFNNKQLKEKN